MFVVEHPFLIRLGEFNNCHKQQIEERHIVYPSWKTLLNDTIQIIRWR